MSTITNNNGKVIIEARGRQGASAYEVWLKAGNTGTVTDFLESIKGPSVFELWMFLRYSASLENEEFDAEHVPYGDAWLAYLDQEIGAGSIEGVKQELFQMWMEELKGEQGPEGPMGATILFSAGVPSNVSGRDGDLNYDVFFHNIYRKVEGSWTNLGTLRGPAGNTGSAGAAGTNGATWHTAAGTPAAGLGVDNDLYYDHVFHNVYKKYPGFGWFLLGNIKGADGAAGAPGAPGGVGGYAVVVGNYVSAITLGSSNANGFLRTGSASHNTVVTVPTNTTWPAAIGTEVIVQKIDTSANTVTIVGAGGVSFEKKSDDHLILTVRYDTVRLVKVATNAWNVTVVG